MNKICLRCNHEWMPRVENPLSCPNCKSRKWNESPNSKREVNKE